MVELVYTIDSKPISLRSAGSIPVIGIKLKLSLRCDTASFGQSITTFRVMAFRVTTEPFKEMNLNVTC